MTLAVGVNAHNYFEQHTDRLTIVDLLAGGMTNIPLDAEGATPYLFGGSVQWSPDGTKFAFSAAGDGGLDEVRVCNVDGSGLTTILHAVERFPVGPGVVWDSWAVYDWWPDNSGLLISWCDSNGQAGKIMRCNPDGSGLTTLYDDPAGALIGKGNNNYMALSPDGSQIVVVCDNGHYPTAGVPSLNVLPANGGALVPIYTDPVFNPSLTLGCCGWRPGPKIVFMSPGVTNPRINTINGDGSGLQSVKEGPNFSAVWASDTEFLVVKSSNGANPLSLIDITGSETQVPNTVGYWGGVKMSIGKFPLPSGLIRSRAAPGGIRLLPGWDRESA